MSEFFTHVIKINNITKHPNADLLSITRVYGTDDNPESGWPVIFRTQDFKLGDLAIFCSVDALVPVANTKFQFLTRPGKTKEFHKVEASRLKGIFSFGLLVPADPDMQEDDDVMEKLGIGKYDISEDPKHQRGYPGGGSGGADEMIAPPIDYVKYDLDGLRKYASIFQEEKILEDGTKVAADIIVAREKLHGENMSTCWVDGKFHVRSRSTFKRGPQDFDTCFSELLAKKKKYKALQAEANGVAFEELTEEEIEIVRQNATFKSTAVNKFWKAVIDLNMEEKTKKYPDYVFFGEKVGHIPLMNYGHSNDKPAFYLFDIYEREKKRFLPEMQLREIAKELDLPMAPIVYEGPYEYSAMLQLAEGNTLLNGQTHIREGLVIRPISEKDVQIGRNFIRPVLKIVSQQYLSPKK